jgi:hypothetical protein
MSSKSKTLNVIRNQMIKSEQFTTLSVQAA